MWARISRSLGDYKVKRIECLCCGSKNLSQIVDLGLHPFADSFFSDDDCFKGVRYYPLACLLCNVCGLIQTSCITRADDRYTEVDYAYNSENSSLAREHWEGFVANHPSWGVQSGDRVIEIGSNDGYLLSLFKKVGCKTLGIDPAHTQSKRARQRGLEIVEAVFTRALAMEIRPKLESGCKLLVANNVFNHSDDPLNFLNGVSYLLEKRGVFVFEVPYWGNLVDDGKFEQIYHEHVSYFTVKSVKNLLHKAGMKIVQINLVQFHGGSLRVVATKQDDPTYPAEFNTKEWEEREISAGFFSKDFYKRFQKRIDKTREVICSKLSDLKRDGFKIGALGAAAKGNTIINWLGLERGLIEFVLDASPHKIGKKTPGTDIIIVEDEFIRDMDKVTLIVLAWNISEVVKTKILEINANTLFMEIELEN